MGAYINLERLKRCERTSPVVQALLDGKDTTRTPTDFHRPADELKTSESPGQKLSRVANGY